MSLRVLPAGESDIDRLMEIQFSAFQNDAFHATLFPGDPSSPAVLQSAGMRTLQEWREDPSMRVMKCVEKGTGIAIGFAKWREVGGEGDEGSEGLEQERGDREEVRGTALTELRRRRIWAGKPHLLLGLLCVHHEYQRRGAGMALVRWGLEESSRTDLTIYLESSPSGLSLYQRLRFRQADAWTVKAGDWDGDFDRHYIAMLKAPELGTF